jgi:hypothetical protein
MREHGIGLGCVLVLVLVLSLLFNSADTAARLPAHAMEVADLKAAAEAARAEAERAKSELEGVRAELTKASHAKEELAKMVADLEGRLAERAK